MVWLHGDNAFKMLVISDDEDSSDGVLGPLWGFPFPAEPHHGFLSEGTPSGTTALVHVENGGSHSLADKPPHSAWPSPSWGPRPFPCLPFCITVSPTRL